MKARPLLNINRRGGFTLLEIVVALAVLSIALAALLSTMNRAIYSVAESARLTEAVTMAREEMELYRMEATGTGGTFAENVDEWMKEEKDISELRVTRRMEQTVAPGAYELIVGVYRGEGDDEIQVFELRQYVALGNIEADGT